MPNQDSRKKTVDLLKQTLANKDFAQARRLLETNTPKDASVRETRREDLSLCAVERGTEKNVPPPDAPGPFWSLHATLAETAPECLAAVREFAAVLRGARQRVDELAASPALCHVQNARPEDLLFAIVDSDPADADRPVVLVSTMRFEREQLLFEHRLARTRDEETALLHALAQRLGETGVLAAFDNKTLDVNHLRQRAAALDVDLGDRLPPRLNLHDESRRRWKHKLATFRLPTLEKLICHRSRRTAPPRPDLTDARTRFLTDSDPAPLSAALHHHRLDLLTQAQLLTAILTQCDPEELDHRQRRQKRDD